MMSVSRDSPPGSNVAAIGPMLRDGFQGGSQVGRSSRSHEMTLDWFAAAERVGRRVDLDASAHAHGAMLRRRGVPSATNLLCLAFLYGPGRMPLRLIAERCAVLGIAKVSEPALLRRLINAADWLEHLADTLILEQLDEVSTTTEGGHSVGAAPAQIASGLDARNLPQVNTERALQLDLAKRFILDFVPWPQDLYSDMQVHWLLCIRWMFVTSTIKDGPMMRPEQTPISPLDRTRMMAHLIAAVASRDL